MKAPVQQVIEAIEEIDRCLEVLRLVELSLHSSGWLPEDFKVTGNVVYFTAERIELAKDRIYASIK